jgi:hypothetical protein
MPVAYDPGTHIYQLRNDVDPRFMDKGSQLLVAVYKGVVVQGKDGVRSVPSTSVNPVMRVPAPPSDNPRYTPRMCSLTAPSTVFSPTAALIKRFFNLSPFKTVASNRVFIHITNLDKIEHTYFFYFAASGPA